MNSCLFMEHFNMDRWEDLIRDMSKTTVQAPEVMEMNSVHLNWCYAAKNLLNYNMACPDKMVETFGEWHKYAAYVFGG